MNLGIRHTLNPFWDRYESDSKKVGFDSGQDESTRDRVNPILDRINLIWDRGKIF